MGPRELTLRRPVGYRRDLAGCALKKSSCISHPLRSGVVFVYYQKAFLPAINRHQVRHHLLRHGQCCAVGIAFLFLLYTIASSGLFRGAIFAASIRTVCRCLLRCFESGVRLVISAELLSAPHSPQ